MNKRDHGALDKAASRLMALDSPTYGDERERAVFMEASTFGLTLGIYVSITAAVVAAVLGQLLLPVVLLVVMAVPNWSTLWYARRKGVDIGEMASRADLRSRLRVTVTIIGGLILVAAAMLYTVVSSHGLITAPEVDLTGGAALAMLKGALVGAVVGGVPAAVAGARKARRGRSHSTEVDEE
ncbi:hypothetical protein [Georgenia sp. SYP-B2076]|uniref:hypothetical protein n=1 Tax=Georgenia sp. SYP-B2076 TaxID=2495881 RepID=UPI000F8C527D|nr:hypothetical protein [Georgenia sp. SYP-B2076]